ncbi:macrodomain Ori organization protein MaoP [Halovulum dunhuangense]|uniref:Macrodomain Ori organization protein MaoP n=1 Tax=Halovulum dunhuangense TaxID=1505036 RepID=A0A849L2B0_9RHOB|nr:DUF413 domain-containing protein [Halovulum dunhuangense]NNU80403.1 macrodomain Ori organization protein MaoP [Halovulum dunhuangense]
MNRLTSWDLILLKKHLAFYEALANGTRVPATHMQKHFLEVVAGLSEPQTQHETAYIRYLQFRGRGVNADTLPVAKPRLSERIIRDENLSSDIEAAIDAIEEVEIGERLGRVTGKLFSQVKRGYIDGRSKFGNGASEVGLWVSALVADRELASNLSRMTGDTFNNVSDVYTKAMDGAFAEGLKAGSDYVAPSLHRLVDGGHSLLGSFEMAREAMTNDTQLEELSGWVRAYLSDLSSPVGMPVATLSEATYRAFDAVVRAAGLPNGWALDAMTFNLEELVSAVVPGLAVLLNWNDAERERFIQMLGGLTVSATVSASPIALLVLIVGAARAMQNKNGEGRNAKRFITAFSEGGLLSGIVVTSSAVIGGPVWIGMVAGILVVMLAKQAGAQVPWRSVVVSVRELVAFGAMQTKDRS